MRPDGRLAGTSRPVRLKPGDVERPKGSVLAEFGETRLLCRATGEERRPCWLRHSKERRGWVTAEYVLPARTTDTRAARPTRDLRGRTQEIKQLIARSLPAGVHPTAVMTHRGRFTEVQGPAEREPFEQHTLGARLNPLWAGIHKLLRRQAAVLDEWGIECGTAK